MNDLGEVTRQRDEAQKACAVKDEALRFIAQAYDDTKTANENSAMFYDCHCVASRALSSNCGKDYAPVFDFKPTIEVLERCKGSSRQWPRLSHPSDLEIDAELATIRAYLRAAQRKET